ncbi:hypothetical protein COCON_G00181410 [Conger conger]|uniref:Uncharacterized protein n=1 Tax=Conger conger TaxID=82655 RepID=A0A9Q1D5N6_CONCO|nr:hypothetical protein COCON_G00181410 [Conger conger]
MSETPRLVSNSSVEGRSPLSDFSKPKVRKAPDRETEESSEVYGQELSDPQDSSLIHPARFAINLGHSWSLNPRRQHWNHFLMSVDWKLDVNFWIGRKSL